jgi:hypothetical protein
MQAPAPHEARAYAACRAHPSCTQWYRIITLDVIKAYHLLWGCAPLPAEVTKLLITLVRRLRRERFVDHLHLALRWRVVGVDLRRLAVGVAEELLDRAQRAAPKPQDGSRTCGAGRGNVTSRTPAARQAALKRLVTFERSSGEPV